MTSAPIQYRIAAEADIPSLARLLAREWGTSAYWKTRITGYMQGTANPQHALASRILYAATRNEEVIGFIAGHLTQRHGCQGELEWINVDPASRRKGVSTKLLQLLAAWFVERSALSVCVDCAPDNTVAQNFYRRNGAETLNAHWLVWKDIGASMLPR